MKTKQINFILFISCLFLVLIVYNPLLIMFIMPKWLKIYTMA